MIRQNGKQYLTVKEYSEAAKISKQAVYSQLKGRLKDFTIEVEKQSFIEAAALDVFYPQEDSSRIEQLEQAEVDYQREHDNRHIEQLERYISSLEKNIKQLEQQLQAKDTQILSLNDRLAEALESVSQEQKLHLVTQQKLQLIEEVRQEEKEQQDNTAAASNKGFFDLFKKKK